MEQPLVLLDVSSSPVSDADEEIFLLYSALNQVKSNLVGPDGYHGLGHIDSRKNTLKISFELQPPLSLEKPTKKVKRPQKKTMDMSTRVVVIEVAQDPTALRSRSGDTGSVVWRASTELAKSILQQHFFPLPLESSFFNRDRLAKSHCLELGAGTGLLGIALAPLVCSYTITDIGPLLSLIRKNVSLNSSTRSLGNSESNIAIEELDWLTLTSLPTGVARERYCPVPSAPSDTGPESNGPAWDLVLVVDCIYNPSLLSALVGTIDEVSTEQQTWVLVVAELRQEDVLREFLDLWLKQSGGKWEITRIDGLLGMHFVAWVGQKRRSS